MNIKTVAGIAIGYWIYTDFIQSSNKIPGLGKIAEPTREKLASLNQKMVVVLTSSEIIPGLLWYIKGSKTFIVKTDAGKGRHYENSFRLSSISKIDKEGIWLRDKRYLNGLGKSSPKTGAVALEILRQLGGNRFLAMTGAKNLAYDENSLQMQLPRNQSHAKYLKIELKPNDTYTMVFRKADNKNFTFPIVAQYSEVYIDQLQEIFTKVTGFDTHL